MITFGHNPLQMKIGLGLPSKIIIRDVCKRIRDCRLKYKIIEYITMYNFTLTYLLF